MYRWETSVLKVDIREGNIYGIKCNIKRDHGTVNSFSVKENKRRKLTLRQLMMAEERFYV